jgi:hypothetical protein
MSNGAVSLPACLPVFTFRVLYLLVLVECEVDLAEFNG